MAVTDPTSDQTADFEEQLGGFAERLFEAKRRGVRPLR